ncbi:MAG: ABC transporter permease [Ureaplasma sp.]|nr:ABC transporter permease [Ureaplasma sp.]MDE7221901.1 ABC transporter permease [Ureaplasma sp.]
MDLNIGSIFNYTFLIATILIFGAISCYFSERVGIANISIEGQMIFAALSFVIFAELIYPKLGDESFILPLIIGSIMTLLSSSIFAFLTINLKANQIVAGTAINIVFLGLATFLTEPLGPLLSNGIHTKLQSQYLSMVQFGESNIYLTSILIFISALIIVGGVYLLIKRTPLGLRFRAIGNNPNAVDAQGINVLKYQWIALTISGAFAGLAGGIYMYTFGGTFSGNINGYGFLALAILIAGSWRIPLLTIVAIAFSFLTRLFNQITISTSLDTDIAKIIPFGITLLALVVFSWYDVAPKNLGIPFDKTKR